MKEFKESIQELVINYNSFKSKTEEMIKNKIIDEMGFERDCEDYFVLGDFSWFHIKNNFNKQKVINYAIKNNININIRGDREANIKIETNNCHINVEFSLDDNDLIEKNKEIITKSIFKGI
jgi:hypothetical protein